MALVTLFGGSAFAGYDWGDFSDFGLAGSERTNSVRLGALVDDSEDWWIQNSTATADDLNGTDDEDGVILPASVQPGQTTSMTVNVTNTSGATAFLNVWIDFNRSGSLTGAGEHVATNVMIANGTINSNRIVNFSVPAGASIGNAGVRVRLTTSSGTSSTGLSGSGEVEDHLLNIQAVALLDYGDLPDSAAGTSAGNFCTLSTDNGASHVLLSGLRLGTTVTTETEAWQHATAEGDVDDGISSVPILVAGETGSLPVRITNTTAVTTYLHVWVDFNNNGVLGDSGEKMGVVAVPAVTNDTLFNVSMPVPLSAVIGSRGMRLRLSTSSVEASTGAGGFGEVEDYLVTISCPSFGITPATLTPMTAGTLYHQVVCTTTMAGPYLWSISSGSLPPGLSLVPHNSVVAGPASAYSNLFSPAASATVNPPNGGLLSISLGGTAGPVTSGIWSLSASGGASVGLLGLGLLESGAQTALTGSSLTFGVSSNNSSLLGALGVGTSIVSSWEATARFNQSGAELNLKPGLRYAVTFDVDGSNGLLQAGLGITPTFTAELLDGAGNAVASTTSGTLINLLGLLGTGVTSGTITLYFDVPEGVSAGAFSLRFKGSAILNTTVLGLGRTFATVSNLSVTEAASAMQHCAVITGVPNGHLCTSFTVTATDAQGCAGSGSYTIINCDFGDFSGFASASSDISPTLRIGATSDAEPGPTTDATATGDDLNGSDDEDGVTLPGQAALNAVDTVLVNVTNSSGATAFLNAWIDFNGNGVLTDPGEQIASNVTVANGTLSNNRSLNFTTPSNAKVGVVGVRVRLTSTSSPGPTGDRGFGEVEDQVLTITESADFGDHAGLGHACSATNVNLRMGAMVDAELTPVTNAAATGDDLNGLDDEDGVAVPASMQQGSLQTITVNVTNTTASTAFLNAWIDFNGNGLLTDAGEQIAANTTIAAGADGLNQVINFTVPANAPPGAKAVRVRLTSTSTTFSTGACGNGEVEDYVTSITCAPLVLNPATLPVAAQGVAYSRTLSVMGGFAPYSYAISAGTLPAGLSLNPSTGEISGTPVSGNGAGTSITLRATDSLGCQGTRTLTLQVCPAVTLSPATLTTPTVGTPYSDTASASAGVAPYTYSITSGALPAGLTLNTSSGVISGTATSTTTTSFTVLAVDANACAGSRAYTMTPVCPALSTTPATLANGIVGAALSQTLSTTGGTSPFSYVVTAGTLPPGITLSAAGVLSGTPTEAGTSNFTVGVTDTHGCTGSKVYAWQVDCPAISITPAALPPAVQLEGYHTSLMAGNGTAPYAWSLSSGTLPDGLTLDSGGVLAGTITAAAGTYTFTVRATDSHNCAATQTFDLVVACNAIIIAPATLPKAYYDTPYTQTLTATKGIAPYTWTVSAGALPAGITLSGAGLLSGTSTDYGDASFTVRVTDVNGCTNTTDMILTVKGLTIGDRVFEDANFNGVRDAGESGVPNVTVELWDAGADHAVDGSGADADVQVGAAIQTDGDGFYQFANKAPGWYYVRVLPPTELPYRGGLPVDLDNGVDDDNNAARQPGGRATVIYGPVMELNEGTEPVADDGDADTDLTIDFALFGGLRLGNRVWADNNDNGLHEPGEPGIAGVALELWGVGADGVIGGGDDTLLRSTTSGAGGIYSFNDLPQESVYVRLPVPPTDHPLASSIAFTPGADDDNDGYQVSSGAVYSGVIDLTAGFLAGRYTDNTVDFGFSGGATSVYLSAPLADGVHVFNSAGGLFNGALNHPFGNSLSQGNNDTLDVPHAIEFGPDGHWYVAHPASSNLRKITPGGVDLGVVLDSATAGLSGLRHFAFGPDRNFYVVDEGGGRVVRFHGPSSTTPGALLDTAPYTFISQTGIQDLGFGPDGNLYLLINDGATQAIHRHSATTGALLNVIATAAQIASVSPGGAAQPQMSGMDLFGTALYGVNSSDGEIFQIDLTDPAVPGTPQLVANVASAGMGAVDLRDIEFNPASGMLFIAGGRWDRPVGSGSYAGGALVRVDPATAPNGAVSLFEDPIPAPPGPANETWSGSAAVAVGRSLAPLPDSVAIGSLVWHDLDVDGQQDSGEPGIANVRVELWRDANNNVADGAETLIGWTFTDAAGHYYFSGQTPGLHQVRIAASNFNPGMPLAGTAYSTPLGSSIDNQADGDDNGSQPAGAGTVVRSPLISLAPGAEPTGAEHARGSDLDDFGVDANGDMTVDFGFVEPGTMGIGNVVFVDANTNNVFDPGEGRDEALVELYRWGMVPGVDQPLATTTTASDGTYLFGNLWQGQYFAHLPASQFETTGSLRGLFSLPGVSVGDDDTGEDSLDVAEPWITGISSGLIQLVRDQAPTDGTGETGHAASSDADDANIDLTVDIGLFRAVALGNLVFQDRNSNGHYDAGEGRPGVRLELYADTQYPGIDDPLAFTTSDADGRYGFHFMRPGNYFVHIPFSQFVPGGALYQHVSISEGIVGDDDVGEDGINNGDPAVNGVSSLVISLFPGSSPTDDNGESGFEHTSDNQLDAAVDLTIDFGFQTPVGVGNLVYIDSNENGIADSGEGIVGVTVELYRSNQTPGASIPIFTQITSDGGRYFFNTLPAGEYILHIPYSEFAPGHPLHGQISAPGASSVDIALDDDIPGHENGLDDPTPFIHGISTAAFTLGVDAEPTSANGETGRFADMDVFDDDNFNLTIDFGFTPSNANAVGVGNLVFRDLNGNGRYDTGEGVDDVQVQLFAAEADPLTATPVTTQITHDGGAYLFSNLSQGDYKVFIAPSEFAAGKPLAGWRSIPGAGGDDSMDDNQDENGLDAADPAATGIVSVVFHLAPDSEPVNAFGEFGSNAHIDDADDDNTDLTIDLGFFRAVAVGNLVFADANHNGRADAGEGVADVTLELYTEGSVPLFDAPSATTTTGADGSYLFSDLPPGRYFVHIPPWQFDFGAPLFGQASMLGSQGGDDDQGEDGIDEGNPAWHGIQSAVFELTPTTAPTGGQESGYLGSSDDLDDDAATDLTIDFGFVPRVVIGNVVFEDINNDGIFKPNEAVGVVDGVYNPNVESGVDGVTVELWSDQPDASAPVTSMTTFGGGRYSFSVAPGSYHIRVPAGNFATDAPLANRVPSHPAGTSGTITTTAGDDDNAQDGYSTGPVTEVGARTPLFTVAHGQAPTYDTAETGYYSDSDDYDDTNGDLTIDLGFHQIPGAADGQSMRRILAESAPGSAPSATDTFAGWHARNDLGGLNRPDDDPDADGLTNLMEYALGSAADNALGMSRFRLEHNATTGTIDALLTRPAGEHRDLRYTVEASTDLLSWSAWNSTPMTQAGADQTVTLRYANVTAAFNGATQGFLRLRVTLDADLNGEAEASAVTAVQGWSWRALELGRQSLSMPLLRAAIYTGQVRALSGSRVTLDGTGDSDISTCLQSGVSYYAEVLDGALAGRVFDINTTSSSGRTIRFTTPVSTALIGARISLRPHRTLGELLPATVLRPALDQNGSDRVMFFDTALNSFQICWLHDANDTVQWVRESSSALTDVSMRVIPPQEGMLVQIRSLPVTLAFIGEVRAVPLALPQTVGTRLIGTGLATPQVMGFQPFPASSRLRLWSGDDDATSDTYLNYLLNPQSRWIDEATGQEVTIQPLLDPFRAFFLMK